MPITKEFTIRLEDRPGTLGKLCQTLAEQDVTFSRINSSLTRRAKAPSVS